MMEASSSAGRLPASLLDDKYLYFSDNGVKDRLAYVASQRGLSTGSLPQREGPDRSSGFVTSGWDKYYFFSDPASATGFQPAAGKPGGPPQPPRKAGTTRLHPTARRGRSRPAMAGPQTFGTEAFSAEEVEHARSRIEAKGPRTTYNEFFGQVPRSHIATEGPIEERAAMDPRAATRGLAATGTLARGSSEPTLRQLTAVEVLAGPRVARRFGPHWPPPDGQRPDPVQTRQRLFDGTHRTVVDLYCRDRQAPISACYTRTNM